MRAENLAVAAVPSRGDFGGAALAGHRQVVADEFVVDREILGLRREGTYIWGALRDGNGDLFSLMRRVPPTGAVTGTVDANSLGDRLVVLSSADADMLVTRREPRNAVSSDQVTRSMADGVATLAGESAGRGRMCLRTDGVSIDYLEEGVLELSGSRVGPGLQWYLPGTSGALYYPTQTWLVEGTALGWEARGFLFVEEAYMSPGARLYVAKDPLHDVDYLTWYSWATRWEDGEVEFGHFLFGQGRFHVGLVVNGDGSVRVVREMDVVVRRAEDGYWHDGLELTLDGEAWELVPDPRGRMRLGPIPNPQQEGLVRGWGSGAPQMCGWPGARRSPPTANAGPADRRRLREARTPHLASVATR